MSDVLQTTTNDGNVVEKPVEIVVKKYSNGYEIIDTGVIHSYNSSEIRIIINGLEFIIQFPENKEDKKSTYALSADPFNPKSLLLKLTNFESSFSEGSPGPLHIANVNNKKIYLSFFVTTIDKNVGARSFAYTILTGE